MAQSEIESIAQMPQAGFWLAHCCAIFLFYLGRDGRDGRDDHHRNPNSNDKDHLVGQLTSFWCA